MQARTHLSLVSPSQCLKSVSRPMTSRANVTVVGWVYVQSWIVGASAGFIS